MGVHLDSLPHPLLGTRGPRRWSSTTQVSDSAGHSVQQGWAPKSPRCLSLLEMWRRHKVTVAEKKKEKEKKTANANRWNQIFQPSSVVTSPLPGTRPFWPALYETHAVMCMIKHIQTWGINRSGKVSEFSWFHSYSGPKLNCQNLAILFGLKKKKKVTTTNVASNNIITVWPFYPLIIFFLCVCWSLKSLC